MLSISIKAQREDQLSAQDQRHSKGRTSLSRKGRDSQSNELRTRLQNIMNLNPVGKYMDLNLGQIMQKYGILTMKFFRISNLRLNETLMQRVVSDYRKMQEGQLYYQHFQISFYADFITEFSTSSQITVNFMDEEYYQDLTWDESQVPKLFTPINNLEVLKNKRLIIILWYLDEFTGGFQVVGQLNVPLFGFITAGNQTLMNSFEMDLTNANEVVGQVDFKMVFNVQQTSDVNLHKQHPLH